MSDARFRLVATVDSDGTVEVEIDPEAPPGLADRIRLMVRTAWRRASEDGLHPPVRLARWRADL